MIAAVLDTYPEPRRGYVSMGTFERASNAKGLAVANRAELQGEIFLYWQAAEEVAPLPLKNFRPQIRGNGVQLTGWFIVCNVLRDGICEAARIDDPFVIEMDDNFGGITLAFKALATEDRRLYKGWTP